MLAHIVISKALLAEFFLGMAVMCILMLCLIGVIYALFAWAGRVAERRKNRKLLEELNINPGFVPRKVSKKAVQEANVRMTNRAVSKPFHPFGMDVGKDHTCSNCGHTEKHYNHTGLGGGGPG